jgi:small redox-active disulfide protein 2
MKIEILGSGCPKCRKLYENAVEAGRQFPEGVEIAKVEDIVRMTQMGMWSTPGVAVDGRLVAQGRLLSVPEMAQIIVNHLGGRS